MQNDDKKINELLDKILEERKNNNIEKEKMDLRGTIKSFSADGMLDQLVATFLGLESAADLKYTEKELLEIEDKIESMYAQGHQPMFTTLLPFGHYLGNLFIKKMKNAVWHVSDEVNESNDIFNVSIKFQGWENAEMEVKPFLRVKKFWRNREDKMSSLLRTVLFTTEVQMDKEYWSTRADDDGWILLGTGDMLRMFVADSGKVNDKSSYKGYFHDGKLEDEK